jgi:hypothetical protein
MRSFKTLNYKFYNLRLVKASLLMRELKFKELILAPEDQTPNVSLRTFRANADLHMQICRFNRSSDYIGLFLSRF